MADLIERDAVIAAFEDADKDVIADYGPEYGCGFGFSQDKAKEILKAIPAVDAVPLVRCKECIKRYTPDCAMQYECRICGGQWSWESSDAFCSFGERRNDDATAD